MEWITLFVYSATLLLLLTYNLGQLSLIVIYLRAEHKRRAKTVVPGSAEWYSLPPVTVQLPIYNERYVVERLIDAIAALHYPVDKLEIQVLDDSTDDSVELSARKVAEYQAQGLNINLIRRPERVGFKAGALAYGLDRSMGEFVAIFDADFVPDPDFLLKTVPQFADPGIGIVQTRWTHLNEDYSLLTQLQAFGLNAHFFIEQGGRNAADLFMNFNGTAGVWRKQAIYDAGGWSSDTLTEDLDLSYRAQLKGWKFIYREDIGSPAELPVAMAALKSQQYRWMKGAAECARKIMLNVLRAPGVPVVNKLHAFFHLFSSSTFLLVFLLAILSVPVLYIRNSHPEWATAYYLINFFQYNLIILLLFYGIPFWLSSRERASGLAGWRFIWYFPAYSSLMMGLSLHNTIAVIEGYIGRKTPFVRTPKFNVANGSDSWRANVYVAQGLPWLTLLEGAMMLYFIGGIALGIYLNDYRMLFFHCMLTAGFGMVFVYSLLHTVRQSAVRRPTTGTFDADRRAAGAVA
ncbi:glycosyltransferase family 2 protein [Fibrella sp. HMF5335]|uniref:Glycosyltransferase family 2 protein n=1 Tax=Fibrella rubiginis TaxID=2817060 RepID=A0A939GKR8_9BACT|nr:cellulose synthase family protein [Fibrella rubiginis]MBO0938237.1 glycosyltransferase family 2 protein [Fibrella rubiginis]